jgi:hypothetical protein
MLRYIPDQHLIDLLLGRKILKFFFNPQGFVTLCNENGVKANFTTTKEANRLRSSGSAKGLVDFNGQFIRFYLGNVNSTFGNGLFHEMIFNWVHPMSIIDQIKQMRFSWKQ